MIHIQYGVVWCTPTLNVEPNNWSVKCKFLGDLHANYLAMAEISTLFEEGEYILIPGTKFQLFGAKQFKCECEVVKEILPEDSTD